MPAPTNVKNMFGNLLNGVDKNTKARIHVGVCALLWVMWNCRNDVIFNKVGRSEFLQVIHRITYWINMDPISFPRSNGDIWILDALA
jgi:hypothetical protein